MKKLPVLFLFFLVLTLIAFHFVANEPVPEYRSFSSLSWETSAQCRSGGAPPLLPFHEATIGNWSRKRRTEATVCKSAELVSGSSEFHLEFSGSDLGNLQLEIRDGKNKISQISLKQAERLFPRERNSDGKHWTRYAFRPAGLRQGDRFTLVIQTIQPSKKWFAVRNRISFFERTSLDFVYELVQLDRLRILFSVALAIVFALVLSQFVKQKTDWWFDLALLIFLGFFIHLRPAAYYYWDEWHVLERFATLDWRGIIYRHNEHFIPLFFFLYFLEVLFFGKCYLGLLFLSLVLHAITTVLLSRFLFLMLDEREEGRSWCRLLAFFYFVSSLHGEVMGWAFVQCVILSGLCSVGCFWFALRYIKSGARRHLAGVAASAFSAPLLFGNGFSLLFQLCLILGVVLVKESVRRTSFKRSLSLIGVCGGSLLLVAIAYRLWNEGAGHGMEAARPLENLAGVVDYIFVGSEAGTVMRSLGPLPVLNPSELGVYLPEFITRHLSAEFAFAWLGLMVSMLLAVFYWSRGIRHWFAYWLFGHLFLMVVFLLPALGRWQLGVGQSLSLRYQYMALLGFSVALLPLGEAFRPFTRYLGTLWAVSYISIHLVFLGHFDYFRGRGAIHQMSLAELDAWNQTLGRGDASDPNFAEIPYDGSGTEYSNLAPTLPWTLTPALHPDQIAHVLDWMKK